jgi:hypothetical protein
MSVIDLTGDDSDTSESGAPSVSITAGLDSLDSPYPDAVMAEPGPSSSVEVINLLDDSDNDNLNPGPTGRDRSVEPRHRSVIEISDDSD